MSALLHQLAPIFHKVTPLRKAAKKLLHGVTITQAFHGGRIALDMVEHSWAWTGSRRYQTFDLSLQEKLLELSRKADHFLDIGSNIGAMTLTVMLRNDRIRSTSVDPNSRAVALLNRSLKLNNLEDRGEVIRAAVACEEGTVRFDPSGSVTGHIAEEGEEIKALAFAPLIDRYSKDGKCLVKLDVEAFEVELLPMLSELSYPKNVCFVVETHPKGMNRLGDPKGVLAMLTEWSGTVRTLDGKPAESIIEDKFTNLIASGWD